MLMPNPSQQRVLWQARLDRFRAAESDGTPDSGPAIGLDDDRLGDASALRVQIGRALISLGSWLSDERVEPVRRANQPTA